MKSSKETGPKINIKKVEAVISNLFNDATVVILEYTLEGHLTFKLTDLYEKLSIDQLSQLSDLLNTRKIQFQPGGEKFKWTQTHTCKFYCQDVDFTKI